MKTALIIGHPGHELRAFRFLEMYKPVVYVLTDGSGNNNGISRLSSTSKILKETGSSLGTVYGEFTDRQIYDLIINQQVNVFGKLIEKIRNDLRTQRIDMAVGDACEGYNPTHDLCRYMINAIINKTATTNYDFLLDQPPNTCPENLRKQALWIHLSQEDLKRKISAAQNYPELFYDLKITLEKHGEVPFLTECYRPVLDLQQFKMWESQLPYYETYGLDKVKEGKYKEVISFEKHLRPLAEQLCAF